MKKLLVVFVLGVGLAAGVFGALHYHVVKTSDDVILIAKSELTFDQTFVDTREWGPFDYLKNPEITSALAQRGLNKLAESTTDASEQAAEESKELIERSRKALGSALQKAGKQLEK